MISGVMLTFKKKGFLFKDILAGIHVNFVKKIKIKTRLILNMYDLYPNQLL